MRALTDATAGLLAPIKLAPYDRLYLSLENDGRWFRAKVRAENGSTGFKNYPSPNARTGWQQRIQENKHIVSESDTWLLAATDYTAEVLRAVWRDQLVPTPEAEVKLQILTSVTTMQDGVSEGFAFFKAVMSQCVAEYKSALKANLSVEALDSLRAELIRRQFDALPAEAHALEQHPDLPLDPHQLAALWLSLKSVGYNLLMEQGTGKTAVTVARVMNEIDKVRERKGRMYRGVIVVPRAVRLNWCKEFARFCTRPGKVVPIRGGYAERARALIETVKDEPEAEFAIAVMSWESLKGSWDFLECIEWDLGVLDEAHYAKTPTSSRSQYTRKLRDICDRRMALTGTPVSNTSLDLYALFEFLHEGGSGFQSWKAFKDFYGVFEETGDGFNKLVGIQNLAFMKERLTRTAFIVSLDEALPWLPEKTFDTLEAEMGAEQKKVYEAIATELAYSVEDQLDKSDNKAMTIQNILTQLLRLAQVCSGYVSWDKVVDEATGEVTRPAHIEYFKENPKLDTLVEELKSKGPNDKTIVWSCFVPCITQISERLTAEGIEHVVYYGSTSEDARTEAERAFNEDPSCKVFVGNQAAGGTGLNLLGYPPHGGEGYTTDSCHTIYYVCDWSYIKRSQSSARNHRRGTRRPVRETDLVVPESVDEDIRVRVMEKKLMAMEVSDVRSIVADILNKIRG